MRQPGQGDRRPQPQPSDLRGTPRCRDRVVIADLLATDRAIRATPERPPPVYFPGVTTHPPKSGENVSCPDRSAVLMGGGHRVPGGVDVRRQRRGFVRDFSGDATTRGRNSRRSVEDVSAKRLGSRESSTLLGTWRYGSRFERVDFDHSSLREWLARARPTSGASRTLARVVTSSAPLAAPSGGMHRIAALGRSRAGCAEVTHRWLPPARAARGVHEWPSH